MNRKPVFIITNDQGLFLINYNINSTVSVITWSPDSAAAFVFLTARRADRIKNQLVSRYQLFVIEAQWINTTLQLSSNPMHQPYLLHAPL